MNLTSLLNETGRPCTVFEAGGFRPTNTIEESWLGRVSLFLEHEEIPTDVQGKLMMPLAQFYLPTFSNVPQSLSSTSILSVFMSDELQGDADLMDGYWLIREYQTVDKLVTKDPEAKNSFLKPFPLKHKIVDLDHPIWDGGGLSPEHEEAFLRLERSGEIEDYYDVTSHQYQHKFGGYPSFCQSGVDLDPYEFVFQISSDPKINLNVIDGGSLMFWRHPVNGDWKLYYDFY